VTNALYGVSELEFVCRSCETGAVRRPAARRFVQDAQSAVQQSHGTLGVANESPSSPAGRRPASRSRSRGKHTRGQLLHTMHSPPCRNVLSSCHSHSPPLCLLERRVSPGSWLARVPARGVAKWHSVDRRYTWFRSSV